tara:strand:- start:105 stop:1451 length:1347 start_codon:yes stop_codon:yes gene_type:complete
MPIIYTYPDLGSVDGTEKILISGADDNTKTITTAAYGAYINATYGGATGNTIFQADGSITANRQLSGSSLYSLTLDNLTTFTVNTVAGGDIKLNPGAGGDIDVGDGGDISFTNTNGIKSFTSPTTGKIYWNTDLSINSPRSISFTCNDANGFSSFTHGANGLMSIINGLVVLSGVNNDISDITSGTNKTLTTKEWVSNYVANFIGSTNITTLGTITTGTWNATTIATTKGGTGLTSYSTGDILYASAPNVLSKLTLGTSGHILVAGASIPAWQALTVNDSNWSGTDLAVANGGTGASTAQAAINTLTAVAAATNEHVLTKDTATGNAVFKSLSTSAPNIYNTDGTISGTRTIVNGGNLRLTGTGLATTTTFDNKAGYGFTNNASVTLDASAIVQIDSTTKGFLLPRMTTTQINAISSPATGLMAYNETLNQICFYNGTAWRKVTDTAM